MTNFNDDPTLDDVLDRIGLVHDIGQRILDCRLPAVMGIHGDWGCGKTSFLNQLQYYISEKCPHRSDEVVKDSAASKKLKAEFLRLRPTWRARQDVVVVWFEAWRYQHEQTPIVALLQEMRAQLSWHVQSIAKAKQLTEVAIRGALLSLEDITKLIGVQASKIEQAGVDWEKTNLATRLPAHTIHQHLEKVISDLCGDKGKGSDKARVVVLIDDLDRCQPEVAFRLLEGIKIYLSLKNVVFVLGMDERIIRRAIASQLQETGGLEDDHYDCLAPEYMEKICQNIWHLPIINESGKLLATYLERLGYLPAEVKKRFQKIVDENDCLPRNPRKIKAFAMVLDRYWRQLEQLGPLPSALAAERHCKLIVIMASLYLFHHDIYRRIEGNPLFYNHVSDWARNGAPSENEVLKNLRLPLEKNGDAQFVDPVLGNVFRIQKVMMYLTPPTTDELKRYLLDQPFTRDSDILAGEVSE